MATFPNPTAQYINFGNGTSTGYYATSTWIASHSYAAGARVRQATTPTVGNERIFICIVAGTSSGTEPSWTVTRGAKTTDNTVTWMEVTGMAGLNGDISSGANSVWTASGAPGLGWLIYDATSGSLQVMTTAGTTGATVPTFSATAGSTKADNTATWTSLGLASGFAAWSTPHARTGNAAGTGWTFAGQVIWIGSASAETQATSISWSFAGTSVAPTSLICASTSVAPPTAATTGASITATSGTVSITIQSGGNDFFSCSGVNFTAAGTVNVGTDAITGTFYGCSFNVSGSNASSAININSSVASVIQWYSCSVSFGSSSQLITIAAAKFTWKGGVLNAGTAVPNSLLSLTGLSDVFVEGVDMSQLGTGQTVIKASGVGYACVKDCKLGSGASVTSLGSVGVMLAVDVMRCDTAGTNYKIETHSGQGDQVTNTSVVRTGGASDGATPVSHQVTTGTTFNVLLFDGLPIDVWNTVLATNRNVAVFGIANTPSMPTNAQFWVDVWYQGSASSTLGSLDSGAVAFGGTPSSLTADTSAWDSAATAWVATTSYTTGQAVAVSSNPGRIFFAQSNGTSSGSLPGGFATAVDGGSVTDNTVTWRAGWRFSLTLTLSSPQPAQVGYITAYPRFNGASMTYFIDPLLVLS